MISYLDLGFSPLGIKTIVSPVKQSPQEIRNSLQYGDILARSIYIGLGDAVFRATEDGMWLGNEVMTSAPFRVDMSGNATLTSATLTSATITGTIAPTADVNMGTHSITNATGVTATTFTGNLSGGSASMGGNIDMNSNDITEADAITCTTLNATTITGLYTATEMWLAPIIPQWTDSWTLNNTYTDVTGSIFDVNFDDLATGWNVYFDIVGKTDAGTGYWQLYNIDDAGTVVGSEISTASTSAVNIRSGAITLPAGTKTLKVQHKIVGGNGTTNYVNSIMAKLVIRLSA